MTTGADAIAQTLRAAGVEIAFGLPGVHNMALWPAFAAAGIRIVGSRHEQGCAYAADGYARATGKLGVALVTTGPGAANTLGAVGEAWASKSPVLVIATDIPSTQRVEGVYKGVLHECTDQAGMFGPVTAVQTRDLATALIAATTPVQGPVYFEVPTDQLVNDAVAAPSPPDAREHIAGPALDYIAVGSHDAHSHDAHSHDAHSHGPHSHDTQSHDTQGHGANVALERPLIWVGGGGRHASAPIDALARRIGAPVITTYSARGVLPAGHPHLVPAPAHEPQVTQLIREAGSTIVIGSDLDAMNTMAWKLPLPAPRIAINLDPIDATKNYEMDVVLRLDASDIDLWSQTLPSRRPWFADLANLGQQIRDEIRADPNTQESIDFLERTERALHTSGDPIVFADMCVAGYWLAGHLAVHRTRGLHYPMGWGTLGWAFPASIGAAAAGEPSVAFIGDGGMLFAIGELATVAQERLPLTIVIVDDGGYGMLRHPHDAAPGCELSPVDFVAVAKGFGVDAEAVVGVGSDYEATLARALGANAPRVLHVHARLFPPRTTSPRWPMK